MTGPGHVRNLRYDSTPSSLIVTWEPPTQQNEPIQLYTVTHRLLQHGSCAEFKRPWEVLTDVDVKDDLKYTAKDLLPFSRYQIVVQAYTKSGKGLPTVTIGITEGQGKRQIYLLIFEGQGMKNMFIKVMV